MARVFVSTLLVLALAFPMGACTNMSKTQQGAVSAGAGGALVGAGIGAITGGSAITGAVIGGAAGAIAGAVYGNSKEHK